MLRKPGAPTDGLRGCPHGVPAKTRVYRIEGSHKPVVFGVVDVVEQRYLSPGIRLQQFAQQYPGAFVAVSIPKDFIQGKFGSVDQLQSAIGRRGECNRKRSGILTFTYCQMIRLNVGC